MNRDFWISEMGHGYGMTVLAKEKIYSAVSPYQKIEIYDTEKLGRMLLLDGIIQLAEADEFAYQEMMTHPAVMAHDNPEKVLVIGGGDGGVVRELCRYDSIREIDLCDIDKMVIEASRKYLPFMSSSLDDPRVNIHVMDGSKFIKEKKNYYDVIIIDSTDPGGPGEPLFGRNFYHDVSEALRNGGVVAAQSESPYLLPDVVKNLWRFAGEFFQYSGYAMIYVPSYPTGCIASGVYCNEHSVDKPRRSLPEEVKNKLRYYTEDMHHASMVLPAFVEKMRIS